MPDSPFTPRFLALMSLIALLLVLVGVDSSDADPGATTGQTTDTNLVVLTEADLPGFINFKKRGTSQKEAQSFAALSAKTGREIKPLKSISAVRKRDGMTLHVSVFVLATPENAAQTCRRRPAFLSVRTTPSKMAAGSPSMRVIGQECWHVQSLQRVGPGDADRAFRPDKHRFYLSAQDGRSVVQIRIDHDFYRDAQSNVIRDSEGRAMQREIGVEDVQLVEHVAQKCLDKLTKMGYTSKSPKPKS